MKLTHSCIITQNIKALTDFYKNVLQIEPETYGDNELISVQTFRIFM